MCKSDWNFDYHGIIFLKEIPWTKSTCLWTDERAPVHGSTVDRSGYPFRVLIWSVHFGFDGWEEGGRATAAMGGTAGLHGGRVTGDRPELGSNGQGITAGWPKARGRIGNSFRASPEGGLWRGGRAMRWRGGGRGCSMGEVLHLVDGHWSGLGRESATWRIFPGG
jgi:hypothetical protein